MPSSTRHLPGSATNPQLDYLDKLLTKNAELHAAADVPLENDLDVLRAEFKNLSHNNASLLIDGFKEANAKLGGRIDRRAEFVRTSNPKPATETRFPTVHQGYYAEEFEGQLRFFKVDRPTKGRWEGYVFVKEVAGSDEWPVKGQRAQRVLQLLELDPKAASVRYGHEIGACGVCGRQLTDPESRANGIGPVCAGKF